MHHFLALRKFLLQRSPSTDETRGQLIHGERGSALVETAVSVPLVLLIMTGIFSFSTALWQKISLAEALGTGGRYLAVDRGSTDPCQDVSNAIYGAAPGLAKSNLSIDIQLNGYDYGWGTTSCPGTGTGGVNTNMVQNGTALVQAKYPVSFSVYGTSYANVNLGGQITEVVQ